MFRALFRLCAAMLLVSATTLTAAAPVAAGIKPERNSDLVLAGGSVSLPGAAASAKQTYGGKVVKAETRIQQGKQVHHIRLVKDGRVKTIRIDAATGRELR